MGERIRQHDWSTSPLGTPDQWPQSLRTTISIILNSRFPMFLFWGPQQLCFYNDAYRPSLGDEGKHPGAIGQPGAQVWPEIWASIKPLIDQVLSGQGATWSEDQLLPIYRNGRLEEVYWTFSYSPVSDESGQPAGVFVTCTETTQAVLTRQSLLRNQERFVNLMTNAPVAMALFRGPQFVIELANEQVLEYWGRQREQVINKPLFEALPEASGQGFEDLLTQVYLTGERLVAKELTVNLKRNGVLAPTYIDFVYEPYRERDGTITGIIVVCVEITPQVLARKALEENEARLQLLSNTVPAMIFYLDAQQRYQSYNDTFRHWFNVKADEAIGKTVREFIGEAAYQQTHPHLALAYAGQSERYEMQAPSKLDPERWLDIIYTPHKTKEGAVLGVIVHATDITQSKKAVLDQLATEARFRLDLEQQVHERTQELASANAQLERTNQVLAATNSELTSANTEVARANQWLEETNLHLMRSNQNLEQFAYIASHDLQEPLRKIQQFGDLLKQRYVHSVGDELEYLNRMQVAASRMSLLIKDLLAFSRISTSQAIQVPVELGNVVQDALDSLSVLVGETSAQIRVGPLPVVQGDGMQLHQLFQNLLSNALKFSGQDESGHPTVPYIQIGSRAVRAIDLPQSLRPGRPAEVYHLIEVSDNGIGFDEKYRDRIFQVFQRLHGKNEFAGTGVGLAIVQKVVSNHSGAITARSQPGQGATFSVYLPVV